MGKRKKQSKPPPKKKRGKLSKVFDCPFCGHEESVDCFLERDVKVGRVECRVCSAKFRAIITHLDEEIDLYHKWIDACEDASKDDRDAAVAAVSRGSGGRGVDGSKGGGGNDTVGGASSSGVGGGVGGKRSVVDEFDDDDDYEEDDE